ncbi:hypothetical protein NP493_2237g00005 [Ridgeia piscesae]|uniref:SWIM-type domain-containing protein n=1 Tax=Ridgeia piscesae TaxID=27915 RepID=A0AAD9JJ24_RIDPI|nr:hypothetical protein NP493_2237g00005 [Ridgeia piscesae]
MGGIARGSKLESAKPSRHFASSKSTSKVDMRTRLYCCGLFYDSKDPYETPKKDWNFVPNTLPAIAYPDIVNYCVYSQSAYTLNDLKGYKSLEAYNQFIGGWVSDVCAREVKGHVVVTARVRHSQSISKTPLQPWIIAEKDGNILSAHGTCMAGLGEVCTHVGAVLFVVSSAIEIRSSRTVTQEKAYCLLPSGTKGINYEQLSSKYPLLLSELRDEHAFHLSKDELFHKCEQVFESICVTNDQVRLEEGKTRQQADCKEWHRFRTDRITASRMTALYGTSVEKPARGLIKAICYPDTARFRTKATQ